MPGKNVVILGGGFGGVAAARTLRKLLNAEHTVTLVDRQRRTYLCGSMSWLVIGERRPQQISRSLGALIKRGVKFVQAEVEGIDLPERRIHTSAGRLPYDYLIVATGAEYDWDAVPGAAENHSFYNLETARRLRVAFRRFREGRIVIAVSGLPYKCPPAPFEAAMLLHSAYVDRGLRRQIEIDVFTPEPMPLAVAGPEAGRTLVAHLARRGITLHTEQAISQVDPDGRVAVFKSGDSVSYDLLVTVPVHRCIAPVREAGLTNGAGWVPADPGTLATEHEGVYAVGDTTTVPMSTGRPLPKAGVLASGEGELVARNLATEIQGGAKERFTGEGHCFVDFGGGKAAMVTGNFLAPERPQVRLTSPSVRWLRRKVRFESDWRRWKI